MIWESLVFTIHTLTRSYLFFVLFIPSDPVVLPLFSPDLSVPDLVCPACCCKTWNSDTHLTVVKDVIDNGEFWNSGSIWWLLTKFHLLDIFPFQKLIEVKLVELSFLYFYLCCLACIYQMKSFKLHRSCNIIQPSILSKLRTC